MAPITQIGKGELEFEIKGVGSIVLRALTPDEEIEVQREARASLVDDSLNDQIAGLEYLDKFRVGSLSYSIVQINSLDLRNVEFVETGEKLKNGTPVRRKRHEALAQIIRGEKTKDGTKGGWSKLVIQGAFQKFAELMNRVEREAEEVISFDPVDYDAEIARLEDRVRELREEKARQEATKTDARTVLRNQITAPKRPAAKDAGTGVTDEVSSETTGPVSLHLPPDEAREVVEEDLPPEDFEEGSEVADSPVEDSAETESLPAASGPRASVFVREKGVASPPPRFDPPHPEPEVPSAPPVSARVSGEEIRDSFAGDEKAIEEENRRLLEMRQRRIPPHLAAKTAQQEVLEKPSEVGTRDGMPVFKMPTQVLSDRGKGPGADPGPPKPNPNLNPRFRPARKT